MTTTKSRTHQTRRAAPRSVTLTMKGHAFVWRDIEVETMAARPASATAKCELCDHVFDVRGLDTLSDFTAMKAAPDYGFSPDTLLCKDCRTHIEAEFGTEAKPDVYHILDRGVYGYSG